MRAARATAHNEKSSQVMPYHPHQPPGQSFHGLSVTNSELGTGEGVERGSVLPGRYSSTAVSPSPAMPLYVPRRHPITGQDRVRSS